MLLAFCVMQPIEKQINPLASMPIDSIFSFGVPLICRCPAMSKADSDAINGRAAQLHFIGSSVVTPSWCMLSSGGIFNLIFSFKIDLLPWPLVRQLNGGRDACRKLNIDLVCDLCA